MKTEAELYDRVDPVAEHTHTLQSVVHQTVIKDDLVITRLDSASTSGSLALRGNVNAKDSVDIELYYVDCPKSFVVTVLN